jgi:hypothetical protein
LLVSVAAVVSLLNQINACLYYPRRASLAPKLRAFIDVAKKTPKSFE